MTTREAAQPDEWNAVIARALAMLVLDRTVPADAKVQDRARFLVKLGLPRADVAQLLNSTEESVRKMTSEGTRGKGKDDSKRKSRAKRQR